MQELEKILEEIEAEFDRHINTQLKIIAGLNDDVYRYGYGKSLESYQQGKLRVTEIIRKHMNDNNSCGECSRRKWYQIGYKDGKDDGWISAEERMPEEYGEYLVTIVPSAGYLWAKRIIANFSDLMGIVKQPIFYTGEVGKIDFEDITDMVIAWRPLPEPYRPEGEKYDC